MCMLFCKPLFEFFAPGNIHFAKPAQVFRKPDEVPTPPVFDRRGGQTFATRRYQCTTTSLRKRFVTGLIHFSPVFLQ